MSTVANVAAAAVDTMKRDAALRVAAYRLRDVLDDQGRISETKNLVADDKVRIANEKMILVEEVQTRVRNNLQLIYAMLGKQLQSTSDAAAIAGLGAISRRVMTLVQLYDHVISAGLSRTIDFRHLPDHALHQIRISGIRPAGEGETDMPGGAGRPRSG